jgi:Mn2+/Fe2+ NRAMP family transporter
MRLMTALILLALLAIVASLAGAGVFMLRRTSNEAGRETRMARALALRVGLSIALFLFVLLSWWMGWIQPSGLPLGR